MATKRTAARKVRKAAVKKVTPVKPELSLFYRIKDETRLLVRVNSQKNLSPDGFTFDGFTITTADYSELAAYNETLIVNNVSLDPKEILEARFANSRQLHAFLEGLTAAVYALNSGDTDDMDDEYEWNEIA